MESKLYNCFGICFVHVTEDHGIWSLEHQRTWIWHFRKWKTGDFRLQYEASCSSPLVPHNRRIYIVNFAIFKITTFWSYHLHLRENSRSFSLVSWNWNFASFWLVVRMCDHRLQCMHSCMHRMQYAWGPRIYIYTFQRARVASSPEVPKVTWWKVATFLRLPFTLANFAWNFAKFQKNRTPAWYFSGEVSSIVRCSC